MGWGGAFPKSTKRHYYGTAKTTVSIPVKFSITPISTVLEFLVMLRLGHVLNCPLQGRQKIVKELVSP